MTIGELTVDDVVLENEGADWKQAGGGGLYSAVGAKVWSDQVALNSVIGHDYPAGLFEELSTAGLDTRAVTRSSEAASIGLWLLYESDGTRRQLEKKRGSTFAQLDALRRSPFEPGLTPEGVHIAPQSSQGQIRALDHLDGHDCVSTLDVLIEPSIDRAPYMSGEIFGRVSAFLPSEQEVIDLWGHRDIRRLARWLAELGHAPTLAIKRGAGGVDVLVEGKVIRVPSVVRQLLDPTGAGDAFCGGFLAGLVETGDPVEAAVRGVVSASFVCETQGALSAIRLVDDSATESRTIQARKSMKEVQ